MAHSFRQRLDLIDISIREGHLKNAKSEVLTILNEPLARPHYVTLANLLRRLGLLDQGIKLLNPIIRGDQRLTDPSDAEKIEYANLLIRLGAIYEASVIIDSLSAEKNPTIFLTQAFILIPDWKYAETIPLLTSYLEKIDKNSYESLIANVNLIAACVFCNQNNRLQQLFKESQNFALKNNYKFLLGSLYELQAQWMLGQKKYSAAQKNLEQAQNILSKTGTQEAFFVKKWKAILAATQEPTSLAHQIKIKQLRIEAQNRGDWESVRDMDFQTLKLFGSQKLFAYLYAGSPNKAYRERLKSQFDQFQKPENDYLWKISGHSVAENRLIHLKYARIGHEKIFTEPAQAPHRLLLYLSRDFYRPQRIAAVASHVFPGEHYHPIHTPSKIHQIVKRLRQDLKKNKIPLQIHSAHQMLNIRGQQSCNLVKDIRDDESAIIPNLILFNIIKLTYNESPFTAKEASDVWKCSIATASRRLNQACNQNHCQRMGLARNTQFKLSQVDIKK